MAGEGRVAGGRAPVSCDVPAPLKLTRRSSKLLMEALNTSLAKLEERGDSGLREENQERINSRGAAEKDSRREERRARAGD